MIKQGNYHSFLFSYLEFIPALQWEISLKLLCSNTLVDETMKYSSFAKNCVMMMILIMMMMEVVVMDHLFAVVTHMKIFNL